MHISPKFFSLAAVAVLALSGCAHQEAKLGRGIANFTEFARGGEIRRTMEQTALFEDPETAYTTGFLKGVNRSFLRTGVGAYEILTFPFKPYDPQLTHLLTPKPVYPDNYRPGLLEDSMFAPDTAIGFGSGDVLPFVPGSRFRVFDH